MAKDEKRIDGFLGILTSTEEPEEPEDAETRPDDADADTAGTSASEGEKPRSAKRKKSSSREAQARKDASHLTKRKRRSESAKGMGAARTAATEPLAEQPAPEERAGQEQRASGPVEAAGAPAVTPATGLTGQLLHVPQREQLPLRIPKNHRFPADLYEKIEAVVYWERLPSNTQFIVNACQAAIDALESARGKPYPRKPS